MELTVKSCIDDETKEIIIERFSVNGEEVSEETYLELLDGSCCKEEKEKEIETIEEAAETMADTLMKKIGEDLESGKCPYCSIKEKLIEAFLEGYETGRDEVEDAILDSLGYERIEEGEE